MRTVAGTKATERFCVPLTSGDAALRKAHEAVTPVDESRLCDESGQARGRYQSPVWDEKALCSQGSGKNVKKATVDVIFTITDNGYKGADSI